VMYEGIERELRFQLAACISCRQGNHGKHGLVDSSFER